MPCRELSFFWYQTCTKAEAYSGNKLANDRAIANSALLQPLLKQKFHNLHVHGITKYPENASEKGYIALELNES